MKAAKTKTTPAQQHQQTSGHQPFFNKEGGGSFFSDSKAPADYFFSPASIQPKLTIGKPNDKYEIEADNMADKVVRKLSKGTVEPAPSAAPAVQKKCTTCEGKEKLQRKPAKDQLTAAPQLIQTKPIFESKIAATEQKVQRSMNTSTPVVQKKCSTCEGKEKLQRKPSKDQLTAAPQLIQTKPIFESKAASAEEMVQQKVSTSAPTVQKKCTACEEKDKLQKKGVEGTSDTSKTESKTDAFTENATSTSEVSTPNVIATTAPPVQAKCSACEEEKLQKKEEEIAENDMDIEAKPIFSGDADPPPEEQPIQASSEQAPATPTPDLQTRLNGSKGGGRPMSKDVQQSMGSAFGTDFSNVRIHTDNQAIQMSQEIGAQAFTHGSDIYFNSGKYNTGSSDGKHLLAHELTHTIQQGATSNTVQRIELPGFIEDAYDSAVDTAADGLGFVGDELGITDDVVEVYDAANELYDDAADLVDDAVDAAADFMMAGAAWLLTGAGFLAKRLVSALGGTLTITSRGIILTFPKVCPVGALDFDIDVPEQSYDTSVPIFGIPVGPGFVTGEIGVKATLDPHLALQAGPFCLEGARIVINPFTSTYSTSGSISATLAASMGLEARAGLTADLKYRGVVLIGGVPVPIELPIIGLEGGIAGLGIATGVSKFILGGGLSYSGGALRASAFETLEMGLAGDLYLGAYGQMNVLGENFCRLYWEPLAWHDDIAGFITVMASATLGPSSSASFFAGAGIGTLPFDQFDLVLSRDGFSDDCPIKDRICHFMDVFNLFPSRNGGVWSNPAYGAGPRVSGPFEVYQVSPGSPRTAKCRGACGIDCDTCTPKSNRPSGAFRLRDPLTGELWDYYNFQDCNSNVGCKDHDAAFDWAQVTKGETGRWAMIMPWHMAANMECACNHPALNCPAWALGWPPYDSKLYFADKAVKVTGGGGGSGPSENEPKKPEMPSGTDPVGMWGDYYHYSQTPPGGNFRPGSETWTDYMTNCRAEAQGATGVPDALSFITGINQEEAQAYIDPNSFASREFHSLIFDTRIEVRHYRNHTAIPENLYFTQPLTILSPGTCSPGSAGGVPSGNEEQDLEDCDRGLLPEDFCEDLYNRVIERFGNRHRNIDLDPDEDIFRDNERADDAPILESFNNAYNRLDSWKIYINHNHPDFVGEFDSRFQVEQARDAWLAEIKRETKEFKKRFRDIDNTDPDQTRREFEQRILQRIEGEITVKVREIAVWYKAKTGTTESIDVLIERIHDEGTGLWRAAWRAAILAVNRVLSRIWPPAKARIIAWVNSTPGISGRVGDIDYIGSLAKGYKGPPKQYVRFNPDNFDVDANLNAPPLASYAQIFDGQVPDRERIFGRNTSIIPLNNFSDEAHRELSPIPGYDSSEVFDVAIDANETVQQGRQRIATERLYALRDAISTTDYTRMVGELTAEGLTAPNPDTGLTEIKGNLSASEFGKANAIFDRYEP